MSLRQKLGIDTGDLVLIGGGLILVWYLWNKTSQAVSAVTGSVSTSIADIVNALTLAPPMNAAGNLDDINGNLLGPISSFPAVTKMYNGQYETFLNVNGNVYELGPRDAAGNFTAQPVGTNAATGTLSPAQSIANTAAANSSGSAAVPAWGITGNW